MRTHVIKAVFKRNFLSYFSGVIGYLFIVAFVGLGSFLAFRAQFFANNLANLDQLNTYFPILLLFIIPAITMTAWADERKLGTDELLFTLPASDLEILLGKYLAVLGVYTVALLFSMSHIIVLMLLGSPDLGLMLATYFGYWVTGAAMLSAGMAASILTNSPTVAYVLGAILCAIPVFIDLVLPGNRLLQGLSVNDEFRDFGMGMIPLGSLLYFLSFTVLMLYINLVLIARRHWAGGPNRAPMGAHYLARTVSLAAILIGLNVVAANASFRADLTSEHLYSLSPTTRDLLRDIKPDRPVMIQAFISPEVPREYVAPRTTLIGLLRQYDQVGGKNVLMRIVDTEKYSDAAEEAKRYGIQPQEVQSERGGRIVREDVYLGVVITAGLDNEVIIPFFDLGTPTEYELTRSIRTVSMEKRKTIGVLRTDAKLTGGFDMQSFSQTPEWRIVTELKKQYEVKEIGPNELLGAEVDVLLAPMPSSLTDPEMKQFVDYLKGGKPALIIDDPFPLFFAHTGLSPKSPKPKPGGMFGQGPPPQPKADISQLTEALGVSWNSGETVWDLYDPHPELSEAFANFDVVYVGAHSSRVGQPFNPKSEISNGLQEVMLLYPGDIRPRDESKIEFTSLMRTSPASYLLDWEQYVRSNPFGGVQPIPRPEPHLPSTPTEYTVAARIKGKTSSDGPDAAEESSINAVFIADLDMIADTLFMVRDKEWQNLKLDNITFVLNSVDELASDGSYVALRRRRPQHRTLARVEERTEKFKKDFAEFTSNADRDAKKQLEDARKRLADVVKAIEADKTLDERTKQIKIKAAQENERRRLEVEEANIQNEKNQKVRQEKTKMEREIRRIEDRIRFLAMLIPPIPALLLGIFVFSARVRDERQGINPDRLVAKKSGGGKK